MASNQNNVFVPPPPDQITPLVDEQQRPTAIWQDWFLRMWKRSGVGYQVTGGTGPPGPPGPPGGGGTGPTGPTGPTGADGANGMVPYYIAPTETFTVPLYKQALFEMTIDNQGTLVVDGYLIQVS